MAPATASLLKLVPTLIFALLVLLVVDAIWDGIREVVPYLLVAATLVVAALTIQTMSAASRAPKPPVRRQRRRAKARVEKDFAIRPASPGFPSNGIQTALIIKQPWIGKILHGEKIWEMRTTRCTRRGRIGLIEQGTGRVVGVANIVGCLGPLNDEEIRRNFDKHRVPPDSIGKWRHAWILGEVQELGRPVPYQHRSGAVIFVTLDANASHQIEHELNSSKKTKVE